MAFSMFEPKLPSISPGEKRARSRRTWALSTEGPAAFGPNAGVSAASFTFSALSEEVAGRLAVAAPAEDRNERAIANATSHFSILGHSGADRWIEAHV